MRPALAALFLLLPLAALAETPDLQRVTYECERGVTLPVIYVNGPDEHAQAVAWIEGGLRILRIARSASGARYREGEAGYEIWGKGDMAVLSYGPEDAQTVLLSQCRALPG
ncbi:MliC family protein [Paracoccus bogoriensis]|uniref:MliC family protein n=1 Tax=Paracoccus bogoriensis TaxID=242065 RepID=UPI001C665AB8|nr:MliC family protein [Paracoccus bogoriensis]MBW7056550.1 MliC family protein [Paracoccus bogoriensis]